MIAAAVANHGTLMTPYLVQQIQAPDESTIQSATPAPLSHPVSAAVASDLTQMMIQVTQNPAGTAYRRPTRASTGVHRDRREDRDCSERHQQHQPQ